MSDQYLKCSKCTTMGIAMYYCCSLEELTCFHCSKNQCPKCHKTRTKPHSNSRIRSVSNKQIMEFNCNKCRKTFQHVGNCVQFECKHKVCFKCLAKLIQQSIRNRTWDSDYLRDSIKKTVKCNCGSSYRLDVTNWLNTYCFCCAQKYYENKVNLKYGLAIMENCRNKILYNQNYDSELTSVDIIRLQRECKSCSKLIDGYRRLVGFQDNYGCECRQCYNESKGGRKYNKGELQCCVTCSQRQNKNKMILLDNFYICQNCYKHSMSSESGRENKKQSKQSPEYQLNKKQLPAGGPKKDNKQDAECLICGKKIINPKEDETICQKCIRQNQTSPLVLQLKNSQKKIEPPRQQEKQQQESHEQYKNSINQPFKKPKIPKNQNLVEFNRIKSDPDGKNQQQCISCDRRFQFQPNGRQSPFSNMLCDHCISENEKGTINLPRRSSQGVSTARIRDKEEQFIFRSANQHKLWRKQTKYQDFLRQSQELKFKGNSNDSQGERPFPQSRIANEHSHIRGSNSVMESIIQQFPDVDCIKIALSKQAINHCSLCGYFLVKNQLFNYSKQSSNMLSLCLNCFMTSQAKNM